VDLDRSVEIHLHRPVDRLTVDLLDLRGTLPQDHLEGVHQVALILTATLQHLILRATLQHLILTATLQLIKVTIMIQKL
jgi:hypothetical protein